MQRAFDNLEMAPTRDASAAAVDVPPSPLVTSTAELSDFFETLALIERLHRLLLDVLKDEFERLGWIDLNSVQALLLFNIGSEELSAGDLKSRGYYQGSNVSYNIKKLVEGGYLNHKKCDVDRRSVRISLTDKGREIAALVSDIFATHFEKLQDECFQSESDLAFMNSGMRKIESFWRRNIRFIY